MTHLEYIESYNAGRIKADINKKQAFALMNKYKFHNRAVSKFQVVFFILNWAWFLAIPIAIICFIFFKWWIGVIVLIVGFSIPKGLKEVTTQVVFNQSLKDKDFYDLLIETKTLVIREE
ncbi:MAG: hypothetical protein ACFFDS_02670 [Candidatus Thorarchaeota archaeon]